MPGNRRFLILHGWQNRRPRQHWQWQLAEALRGQGEQVLYPQLPDPDRPSLPTWLELLDSELAQLGDEERVVIAHSLAVLLWLNAVSREPGVVRIDRVLLVSPPSPALLQRHPEVAAFARADYDAECVEAGAESVHLVHSDRDPYCPEGVEAAYPDLHLDATIVPDGGHLDPDSGYGPWPSILAWCQDPATRIAPN
jgi:uncharacterized protein